MIIKSNIRDYEVYFEKDFRFLEKLKGYSHAFFVIDRNVYDLYPKQLHDIPEEKLYLLDAVEENKNISTALDICEKMTNIPAKRNSIMITIGGGICQDISGFAANILYRGINWILVPTTLLSACDSCIGSKTSLNYKKYKNLLGTFYPPQELYIYSSFFDTLSERDFKSGLGEVVKFNVMKGSDGVKSLEKNIDLLIEKDMTTLNDFVKSSLEFKKPLVERDEFDKGDRIALNFAHTFGHAIESVSKYAVPHGTAVAIGMLMANHISVRRGILSVEINERIIKLVDKIVTIDYKEKYFETDGIIEAMKNDKKRKGEKLAAVLLDSQYETNVYFDLEIDEICEAIEYIKNFLKEGNKNEN